MRVRERERKKAIKAFNFTHKQTLTNGYLHKYTQTHIKTAKYIQIRPHMQSCTITHNIVHSQLYRKNKDKQNLNQRYIQIQKHEDKMKHQTTHPPTHINAHTNL